MRARFVGVLVTSAYHLAVSLWMPVSLTIARMERPRSLEGVSKACHEGARRRIMR